MSFEESHHDLGWVEKRRVVAAVLGCLLTQNGRRVSPSSARARTAKRPKGGRLSGPKRAVLDPTSGKQLIISSQQTEKDGKGESEREGERERRRKS